MWGRRSRSYTSSNVEAWIWIDFGGAANGWNEAAFCRMWPYYESWARDPETNRVKPPRRSAGEELNFPKLEEAGGEGWSIQLCERSARGA